MFKPEYMIYLWFVPVFLYFIAPLFILPFFFLKKRSDMEKLRITSVQYLRDGQGERVFNDTRVHPRQKVDGVIAHVSDGVRWCRGEVRDVSRRGLSIVTPAGELDQEQGVLGVLLTGSGKSFPMKVRPQWQDIRGEKLITGAAIFEAVGNMKEFTGAGGYGVHSA